MPKVTIDGKEVEVPKGTRVIEAAKQCGVDVPFYCYHPGLSVAGNCRMCLVEIEKMPKLQIACHMQVQDGMVVRTNTEKILKTRQHILEFLLVNHPLDCPVCDQAGECWLQDYYMRHGIYDSRVNEDKLKKTKAVPVGEHVMLDAERCILCSRCMRFCDEISRTSELGIVNRGDHSEIQVFPGKELANPYSGNVVDICPVGALTDRDFRFKIRVWYLQSTDSVCNGCARGCNITVQYNLDRPHHGKGDRVKRLKPRFHLEINQWWMCDEGRYGYGVHDHNRITVPVHRGSGKVEESNWADMIADTARLLEQAKGRVGIFLSPQMSNEELFLAREFFAGKLKRKDIFLVSPKAEGFQDDLLIRADKNPNSRGAGLIGFSYNDAALQAFFQAAEKGEVEGIVVFGQDLMALHGKHLTKAALDKIRWSIFIGTNHNLMSEYSGFVLPAATYVEKEGTFTNFEGRVQKFSKVLEPLGEARAEWQIIMALAKQLGIHMHYDLAEEIFKDLTLQIEHFKGMAYEKLTGGLNDVRIFAAPMIPAYMQDSNLIFMNEPTEPQPVKPS